MKIETNINIKDTLEYSKIPYNQKKKIIAMVSLEAPEVVTDKTKQRAPIDLVCVIDRSGSMEGEKLNLVKASLSFMVEQLQNGDKLSLVTFDTQVKTEFAELAMDSEGKSKALKVIRSINAGSSTNLSGGIFEGYNIMKKRKVQTEISSILVFTDGLANYGLTKTIQILDAMEKIQEMKQKLSLFTFGFGKDHDPNMLKPIAEAGRGLYYFLEREDEIPNSFADCLGGLLSTVGQNIKVSVKPRGENKVLQSLSRFPCKKTDDQLEISIGDIYSEEKRDLLFEIEIPEIDYVTESFKVLDITLDYFNVLTSKIETFSFVSSIERPMKVDKFDVNYEVDKQRNRIETNEALRKAKEFSDKKDLAEGRKVLQCQIERIEKSISGEDKLCKAMVEDLKNLLKELKDVTSYISTGSKFMSEMEQTTNHQRNTKMTSTAVLYETKKKKEMKCDSETYVSNWKK